MIDVGSKLKVRQIDQLTEYDTCIVLSIEQVNNNITQYHLYSEKNIHEHCYYDNAMKLWNLGLYDKDENMQLLNLINSVTLDIYSKNLLYQNLRRSFIGDVIEVC